jgi:response regulator RpfG family c-di-GMP phosphodiesterase
MGPHAESPASASASNDPVTNPSVLVVDDENGVRDLMSRWLQAGGYSVASAAGADEALGVCRTFMPAVALCDVRMPGRDGLWLAERIRQQFPETAVIVATGVHDIERAIATVEHGVFDYLTKPFGRERLRDAVVRGVEWHRSARDSRCWRERLENDVNLRRARLTEAIGAMHVDSDQRIDALLSMVTMGQPDAYGHAQRVAAMSVAIGGLLGLSEDECAVLRRAAMLHDLGKLTMPEAVLRKPAPLSADEQGIMRLYPAVGADLIADLPYLEEAAGVVRQIQERPDGRGYPAGDVPALSIEARIVAAADAYDTMIHPRVYRDALPAGDALLEVVRCSGTQFDPEVVRALKKLVAAH